MQILPSSFIFAPMKKLIVISVLAAQVGLLFNKSVLVLHFLWHRAEITEQFCHHTTHEEEENCQGICYLSAQLEHEHNEDATFPVQILVQDELVFIENIDLFSYQSLFSTPEKVLNFKDKTPVLSDFFYSVWQPPSRLA